MKNSIWLLLLSASALVPSTLAAQTPGLDDPLATVRSLFDGMREKNVEQIRELFFPTARLMSVGAEIGAEGPGVTPIDRFIQSVGAASAHLDERLWDERVEVNGNLATVWAHYAMYIDGVLSHCGVDAFQLARSGEGWKIFQVADTRQREDCVIPEHVRAGGRG